MTEDQHIWRLWAEKLYSWGLNELAASSIDTLGPLTILGAQVLYLCEPVLTTFLPRQHCQALATMLGEPDSAARFAQQLREVSA